jgi:hypothetical protein
MLYWSFSLGLGYNLQSPLKTIPVAYLGQELSKHVNSQIHLMRQSL